MTKISDVSPFSPTADIFTFWMSISGQARNGLSIPWRSKVSSKCLAPKIHLILLQNIVGIVEPILKSCAFRKNWARLIQKIYHVDALLCPECQGTMRGISFIEEPAVIRKILVHLDLWDIRNHDPPVKTNEHIQELTYDDEYSQLPFSDALA